MKINSPNDFIVYNIGRTYVLLNQYLTDVYAKFGLSPAKFNLLMIIKHQGKEKGISQIELGSHLYVTASNITKLIDGLEKKGWIKRISSQKDRRVNLIRITLQGSSLLDRIWVKHVEALNNILGSLPQNSKEKFNNYLNNFVRELEARK